MRYLVLNLDSFIILLVFFLIKGGLAGFVTSLACGLTMIVGTLYYYTFKEPWMPPVSVAGCSANVSLTTVTPLTTQVPQLSAQYTFSFFNLSYLYLTLLCLLVCFVVATIVSLLTGKSFIADILIICPNNS